MKCTQGAPCREVIWGKACDCWPCEGRETPALSGVLPFTGSLKHQHQYPLLNSGNLWIFRGSPGHRPVPGPVDILASRAEGPGENVEVTKRTASVEHADETTGAGDMKWLSPCSHLWEWGGCLLQSGHPCCAHSFAPPCPGFETGCVSRATQNVVHPSAPSTSTWGLLKMQIPGLTADLLNQNPWGKGPRSVFQQGL